METYRLPHHLRGRPTPLGPVPARIIPIFRDRDELSVSADIGQKLREALAQSDFLIVLASPHSARSRWVNEEVMEFKRLGRSRRTLVFIVGGEPNTGDDRECFAPALKYELGAGGQLSDRPVLPIAADIRPGKDRREAAKLKLIAGLVGLSFDEIWEREKRRTRQHLLITLGSVLLLLGLVAGLLSAQQWRNQRATGELVRKREASGARARGRECLLNEEWFQALTSFQSAQKLGETSPELAAGLRLSAHLTRAILEPGSLLHHPDGEIENIEIAFDGRTVVTLGSNGSVVVWSLPDGLQRLRLTGSGAETAVDEAKFDPSGKYLLLTRHASASVISLQTMQEFPLPVGTLPKCVFLPDGRILCASTGRDQKVEIALFDSVTRRSLRHARLGEGGAIYVRVLPELSGPAVELMLSHGPDFTMTAEYYRISVPDLTATKLPQTPPQVAIRGGDRAELRSGAGIDEHILSATTARDPISVEYSRGASLLAWSATGKYLVWPSPSLTYIWDRQLKLAAAVPGWAHLSPDDRYLAFVSSGQISVYEVEGARLLASFRDRSFRGAAHNDYQLDVRFVSPDVLATYGDGAVVRLWNWREAPDHEVPLGTHQYTEVGTITLDGTKLLLPRDDGATEYWDVGSRNQIREITVATTALPRVAFLDDGRAIATGSAMGFGNLKLWNTMSGAAISAPSISQTAKQDRSEITSRLFFDFAVPLGRDTIAVSVSRAIAACYGPDFAQQKWVQDLMLTGAVSAFAVCPRNVQLVALGSDGSGVLTAPGGKAIPLASKGAVPGSLVWSTSGNVFAWVNDTGELFLHDGTTAARRVTPFLGKPFLFHAALSPDGKLVAGTGGDGRVHLWREGENNVTTLDFEPLWRHRERNLGEPFNPNNYAGKRLPNGALHAAFSPDGLWLAAAHSDGLIGIWSVSTQEPWFAFQVSPSRRLRLEFAGSGELLLCYPTPEAPVALRWPRRN